MKLGNCDKCGGTIDVNIGDGQLIVFCPHCGKKHELEQFRREFVYTENTTQTVVDQAEIERIHAEERSSKRRLRILVLVILLVHLLPILFWGGCTAYSCTAEDKGMISAGWSRTYPGMNCDAAVKRLEELGFTNIVTIDLEDSGLLYWTDLEVVNVTIDGDSFFTPYSYYEPEDKVVVTHH